jgi:hypothetical protein
VSENGREVIALLESDGTIPETSIAISHGKTFPFVDIPLPVGQQPNVVNLSPMTKYDLVYWTKDFQVFGRFHDANDFQVRVHHCRLGLSPHVMKRKTRSKTSPTVESLGSIVRAGDDDLVISTGVWKSPGQQSLPDPGRLPGGQYKQLGQNTQTISIYCARETNNLVIPLR